MIASLVDRGRPTHLVACWDNDWRPAFRVEAIPSYKAHRVAEPGPDELAGERSPKPWASRCPIIVDALAALGIARVGVDGYEADDVIGTLATERHAGVCRSTSSPATATCFQLVDDAQRRCGCSTPARGGVRYPDLVDEAFLAEKYGVPHRRGLRRHGGAARRHERRAARGRRASARRPPPSSSRPTAPSTACVQPSTPGTPPSRVPSGPGSRPQRTTSTSPHGSSRLPRTPPSPTWSWPPRPRWQTPRSCRDWPSSTG